MNQEFLNEAADVSWLKQTHLRLTPLPPPWDAFQSFVLVGNEDAPTAVELYLKADPLHVDDYYRHDFGADTSGVYDGNIRELRKDWDKLPEPEPAPVAPAPPAPFTRAERIENALRVLLLTPHIVRYLVSHDPRAYRQAMAALDLAVPDIPANPWKELK